MEENLTHHNIIYTEKRELRPTYMPRWGPEPPHPDFEPSKNVCSLDSATTVIG